MPLITHKQKTPIPEKSVESRLSPLEFSGNKAINANSITFLFALLFTFSSCLLSADSIAEDAAKSTENNHELAKLREQIQSTQETLAQSIKEQSDANNQLKYADIHIAKLSKLIHHIDQDISAQQNQLNQLRKRKLDLEKNSTHHRNQLAQQVRASYRLGDQEYLRILLSAQEPGAVSRMMTYYAYFNQHRLSKIAQATADIAELITVEKSIKTNKKRLTISKKQNQIDIDILEKSRQHRQVLASRLARQISTKQDKLRALQFDEKQLAELLNGLSSKTLAREPVQKNRVPFPKLKGQLPWPTEGKILRRFGKRTLGEMRARGLLISGREGQSVHPVAPGQIIFADWIRGFGMMVIIEHGKNYMSLYGHNTSLYKDTGDWVDPTDIIASVGASGSTKETGLYFELRHKGKPINPARWLQRSKLRR